MAVSFDKIQAKAPELVSLAKTADATLERLNLQGVSAPVVFCLDVSGSMGGMFASGLVQRAMERMFALALRFDDDGEMPLVTFGVNARTLATVTLDNYKDVLKGISLEYGTNYDQAIDIVVREHLTPGQLAFVPFATDGRPGSESSAKSSLKSASKHPAFYQFVGIGGRPNNPEFDFLRKLDDMRVGMGGRKFDNAGFCEVNNPDDLSDQQLLDLLLNEYPQARQAAQRAGVL